ncbi:hypothetical protein ROZALSC1DRAFT_30325 [Rozella allomycis CSF55]|uniref:Uncharacterized protein n=1 Tax=Rozella allomycis (strain CSF55) TaxID=988480 RepID=A0A4P9YFI4_ROZAC|nr:hypothetical protein ROZALSC1DRAFT_30325 [Rozella allomycis CSF55]
MKTYLLLILFVTITLAEIQPLKECLVSNNIEIPNPVDGQIIPHPLDITEELWTEITAKCEKSIALSDFGDPDTYLSTINHKVPKALREGIIRVLENLYEDKEAFQQRAKISNIKKSHGANNQ